MDLSTTYLGMKLKSPLVPSASALSEEPDNIKRMEDAGAAAIVLHSLFEEELDLERFELFHHLTNATDSFAEATSFFPEPSEFHLGAEDYLNQIRHAKEAVNIPIIASLNGATTGGWTKFASQIEQAGADALELNIYSIPTDPDLTATQVEQTYIDILKAVRSQIKIPIAMKLSPFFSNMAHMAKRLDEAGTNALVLFNRFYQPDFDLESLTVEPKLKLSSPLEKRLPMQWIALLYGQIRADLAATTGIHSAQDALKMLMAGAKVTMMCSALIRNGIHHLRVVEKELRDWMEENEYESVQQMQGSMSFQNCEDSSAFKRVQYMHVIRSYKPEPPIEG